MITNQNGPIIIKVNTKPGTDVETVRSSLETSFTPLVKNVTILANQEITTSNNLRCHFYAYEATGANGKRVMLRTENFQRGGHVVYLT